jgi:hypothetical protein
VNIVDELLDYLNKGSLALVATVMKDRPICSLQVFAQVNTVITQQWIKAIKAYPLMAGNMTAIVNDNINATHFFYYLLEKLWVGLGSYSNAPILIIKIATLLVDINPKDDCLGPEVLAPYL